MIPVVTLAAITVTAIPLVDMTARTMVNTFVARIPNLILTTDTPEQPSTLIMLMIAKTTRLEEITILNSPVVMPVMLTVIHLALPTMVTHVAPVILEIPEIQVAPGTHAAQAAQVAPVTRQDPEVPVAMGIHMADETLMNVLLLQCQVFLVAITILHNLYLCLKSNLIALLNSLNVCLIPPIRK